MPVKSLSGFPRAHAIALLAAVVVVLVGITGLGLYVYRNLRVNGQRAEAIQKELEIEFGRIKTPSDTRSLRYSSTYKIHQAEVGSDYLSSFSYQDLRSFYDPELNRNGWRLLKAEPMKLWGRDYSGKQTFYCKGPYTATLQYAGQASDQLGWTYSFALSWGLFDECN
jgi:hypothetical protein